MNDRLDMNIQTDITLVLGIDAKTIEQLKLSWPTWHKNRNQMWDWPLIVFYDREQLDPVKLSEFFATWNWRGKASLVPWPERECTAKYESQRERMLSGHVFVPAMHCQTAWHMKLDTDALARPHDNWIDADWFAGDPSYVAPKWHYTKGMNFLGLLEEWGDEKLPESCLPLNIIYDPAALRVGHSRMCSWCSYYLTAFTRVVAETCDGGSFCRKLPVPSQDTTVWYVAARLGLPHRIENMKSRGWSNHSRIEELRRVAAEIMVT